MNLQNLEKQSLDPFGNSSAKKDIIHIRVQQRNGRKTLTTIQGIPKEFDQKKLLRAFKKEFACNGTIVKDELKFDVIQLQGDQRFKFKDFVINNKIMHSDELRVHGFS